jgi:imidazole glycerol-phosphate synthase subunit HisH
VSKISVGVVDYGVGNLKSVANAVSHLGAAPYVSSDIAVLEACDRLILPGVGAFPHGKNALIENGLDTFVHEYVQSKRRVLGICLGMQLLHEWSSEFSQTLGLGVLKGTVDYLPAYSENPEKSNRMPNVGWLPVERVHNDSELANRMLSGIHESDRFYFIHSYGVEVKGSEVAGISQVDGLKFSSIVARGNLVGTQFHPEKSRGAGLLLLKSFIF